MSYINMIPGIATWYFRKCRTESWICKVFLFFFKLSFSALRIMKSLTVVIVHSRCEFVNSKNYYLRRVKRSQAKNVRVALVSNFLSTNHTPTIKLPMNFLKRNLTEPPHEPSNAVQMKLVCMHSMKHDFCDCLRSTPLYLCIPVQ